MSQKNTNPENSHIVVQRGTGIPHTYFHRVLDGENAIKVYREWRNMTQKQLAEKVGVPQSDIEDLENGVHKGDITLYVKIVDALSVSIEDIVPLSD